MCVKIDDWGTSVRFVFKIQENSMLSLSNLSNEFCVIFKSFLTTQIPRIIFLSQTLHTFNKSSPWKCMKVFRLSTARIKFTKFLISIFKQKVSFFQSLDHSSVSWEKTLMYFFSWNFICYWQKQHIKVHIFRLAIIRIKIHQIPHVIFGTNHFFSSNFESLFSVMRHNSFVFSLGMLWTKASYQSTNFQTFDCPHEN